MKFSVGAIYLNEDSVAILQAGLPAVQKELQHAVTAR